LEIYYADIGELDGERFARGLSLVNEERRDRVLACRCGADRQRALAAGLLVRYVCRSRGVDYDAACFYREGSGKPATDGFCYNVSHSGDYAAIAVSAAPVGIDVERLNDRFCGERGAARLAAVVKRTFDKEETELLGGRCADGIWTEQALLFAAKVWTRKESFAKECGAGLGMDFAQIHTQEAEGFFSCTLPGDYSLSTFSGRQRYVRFPVCIRTEKMLE
jgi:4'-phosphopantetheinyl transferase